MAVTTKIFGNNYSPVFGERPITVIIDDVFGDSSGVASYKEKPMELFKFTTTKPSCEVKLCTSILDRVITPGARR